MEINDRNWRSYHFIHGHCTHLYMYKMHIVTYNHSHKYRHTHTSAQHANVSFKIREEKTFRKEINKWFEFHWVTRTKFIYQNELVCASHHLRMCECACACVHDVRRAFVVPAFGQQHGVLVLVSSSLQNNRSHLFCNTDKIENTHRETCLALCYCNFNH